MAQRAVSRCCTPCFRSSGNPGVAPTVLTGTSPEHYLEVATEFLRQSEEMIDSRKGRGFRGQVQSNLVPLNNRQCAYLVEKLKMAVNSAVEFMSVSTPKQKLESMVNWNLLTRLAMDAQSFVQECCKVEWIQAAKMLIDDFEHVASLDSHLDLCIWGFEKRNRSILGTDLRCELVNFSESQDRRFKDHVKLVEKVEVVLGSGSVSNREVIQRVASVLTELEGAVAKNPTADNLDLLVLSCFHDQVELLRRVEAALSSAECDSDLETYQPVISRFRAAMGNPVSDESSRSDFMRVNFTSLKRERTLGKGACGEVYKVNWLGTPAAEKSFPGEEIGGLQTIFDKEVSILARLSHPSIVRLLCYVKEGAKCSMVLELMDKDLAVLIKERVELDEKSRSPRGSPFSTAEVVEIMLQIAEGMDYLYRRKVLHRDLKSQNILVKCQKLGKVEVVHAKVADFGISKTKEKSITLSHPTWNTGTARWMAPELIYVPRGGSNGNNDTSTSENHPFRSDVYSFGMVCYEILTGGVPFANISQPNHVKRKLLQGDRPDLPSHFPSRLTSMIKKCWRTEPTERPSFYEICTELRFMKGSLLIGLNVQDMQTLVFDHSG